MHQPAGRGHRPWLQLFPGAKLVGIGAQHPFLPRTAIVLTADFVTMDTGTGAVHIAPGHGEDDYSLGKMNGLPDPFAGRRFGALHRGSRLAEAGRQIRFRRQRRYRQAAPRPRHAHRRATLSSIPIPIAGARRLRSSSAPSSSFSFGSTICAKRHSTPSPR